MEFPQVVVKHNIGNTLTIPNQLDIKTATYTSDNASAGATTVPVDNATDFTAGLILLLLSSMGAQNAEIVNSSSHTISDFTTGALLLAHTRGEIVQEINFDQIVILKSPTINGSYTVLTTQTFQVTQQNTVVFDAAGLTTDFYKIQWKNSNTGAVSAASDPISVDSYPPGSVASIVYPVLSAMGVSENDPKITTDFLIKAVNDARIFTESNLYGIRHAWQEVFEFPIKLLSGTNFVFLPDDIDFKETDQSVLAARFIIDNILTPYNLRYIDKRSWNQISFSVMGGRVTVAANISDATLALTSTGDFPDSGVAYVATTAFDQNLLEIQYTVNDRANNVLIGVTGITRAIPVGTQVWQRPTISQPIYYTVYNNMLVFDRVIPQSMQGRNVYIDYYKKIDLVTSLQQDLPEHYREIYKWYLRYAIKYRKDLTLPNDDPDLTKFELLVKALFNNLYTGQDTVIVTS